ncbi:ammonia-dependent NAD(+) synthetase [Flaviflexus huanghaiensis]|uniref:ammonia-dependent NAD(+) synthetase n=1 Tax=Flaviflexus huanghaiensis TaxID=1111473 RepID=UPI0015F834A7|nr:ammonia-dependent NAD(+) synthetase [Flaviflexus huanghaiensis]
MRELQKKIIGELGVKATIDPHEEIEQRVEFLTDYLIAANARGYVLGISGGVDSTLGGRLGQLAVERAREQGLSAEFVAVRLPHHVQHDEADAQAALDFIGADRRITFNIGPAVDAFEKEYDLGADSRMSDFNKGNAKARLRMMAQYAVAGDAGLLVIGTDQAAEAVTGFYTKFGDGGADVMPLSGLTKRQVRLLTQELGGPEFLWNKVPTADLLDNDPGRTDEDELGLSYDDIDDYLEGREVSSAAAQKIEWYYQRSRHKRRMPVGASDTWWR